MAKTAVATKVTSIQQDSIPSAEVSSDKLLLSCEEAAAVLSIGVWYLYKHMNSGALRSIKLGHRRLISRRALEEFVERLEQSTGVA